jgi:hypothetical protein
MPTFLRPDNKPIVQFDPTIEISPFALFRRLKEGHALLLVDVRAIREELTLEVPSPIRVRHGSLPRALTPYSSTSTVPRPNRSSGNSRQPDIRA